MKSWDGKDAPACAGPPATTARKTPQRTIANAAAAPATWGFDAGEINPSVATAIWPTIA